MVPGSTLMYGSSLRTETEIPRALSRRPMLAAVMPFPREEVTPPVTKTYFAMGRAPPGFFRCYRKAADGARSMRLAMGCSSDPDGARRSSLRSVGPPDHGRAPGQVEDGASSRFSSPRPEGGAHGVRRRRHEAAGGPPIRGR